MKKFLTLTLFFFLSILLVACGSSNEKVDIKNDTNNGSGGIVAGEVTSNIEEQSPLVYSYKIKNQTEQPVTLLFTSTQRYDYALETKGGERKFLFSSVASFLREDGQEVLKQGEEKEFMIDLTKLNLPAGDYILKAWMTPKQGELYSATKEITIK